MKRRGERDQCLNHSETLWDTGYLVVFRSSKTNVKPRRSTSYACPPLQLGMDHFETTENTLCSSLTALTSAVLLLLQAMFSLQLFPLQNAYIKLTHSERTSRNLNNESCWGLWEN
ncbi:uncharacterized protein LOC142600499 isoform X2 [Balearica regulorum gibbericeps]|uniref:uncharacterized protein LOC142600499 isoform X2 n=1 Tax=Balearica regulorum gibbericeps TaxID=100784 RepID=UPI003F6073C8